MATSVSIAQKHWSHRVQPGTRLDAIENPDGYWGSIVTGLDDLDQVIRTIVLTPRGSVPIAPDKFCDALNAIDRPPDVAIPIIAREIYDALDEHAPRIVVERVEVEEVAWHHFRVPIFWRPRADVLADIRRTVVDLSSRGVPDPIGAGLVQ